MIQFHNRNDGSVSDEGPEKIRIEEWPEREHNEDQNNRNEKGYNTMCLETTRKQINDFIEQHKDKKEITVWKVYIEQCGSLSSPYTSLWEDEKGVRIAGTKVDEPGIVKSNRKRKRLRNSFNHISFERGNDDEFVKEDTDFE